MGRFSSLFKTGAKSSDELATAIKAAKAEAKVVGNAADAAKAAKNADEVADLAKAAKAAKTAGKVEDAAKTSAKLTDKIKVIKTAEDAAKATSTSLGTVKKIQKGVQDFLKANPKVASRLTKAGLGAAAIGALMIMTGEGNPLKAIEAAIGEVTEAVGDTIGDTLHNAFGPTLDFLKQFWWVAAIPFVLLFIWLVYKLVSSVGTKNS